MKKKNKAAKNHSDYYKYADSTMNFQLLLLLKLLITRTEIFLDEFSHKVCLSMNPQSLNLKHNFL